MKASIGSTIANESSNMKLLLQDHSKTTAANQITIKVIFKNHFAGEYLRNNKQQHSKNLLCFPSCRCDPLTGLPCHNKVGFCGNSVLVEVIISSNDRTFDAVQYLDSAIFVGEIQDKHVEKGNEFWVDNFKDYVGGGISKDTLLALLKDKSSSKEAKEPLVSSSSNNNSSPASLSTKMAAPSIYYRGKMTSAPVRLRSWTNEWSVGVEFNGLPKSWQYLWASNKHVASVNHAFTVNIFSPTLRSSQDMQISGIFHGPLFQVGSKRRAKDTMSIDDSTEPSSAISITNLTHLKNSLMSLDMMVSGSYRDQQEHFETSTTITSLDSDSEFDDNEIMPTKLTFRDEFIKSSFSDFSLGVERSRKDSNLSDGDTTLSSGLNSVENYDDYFDFISGEAQPKSNPWNSNDNSLGPLFIYSSQTTNASNSRNSSIGSSKGRSSSSQHPPSDQPSTQTSSAITKTQQRRRGTHLSKTPIVSGSGSGSGKAPISSGSGGFGSGSGSGSLRPTAELTASTSSSISSSTSSSSLLSSSSSSMSSLSSLPSSSASSLAFSSSVSASKQAYQTSLGTTNMFPLPANGVFNYSSALGSAGNADNSCSPNWQIFNVKNGISPGTDDVIDALDSIFSPGFISAVDEVKRDDPNPTLGSTANPYFASDISCISSHRVGSINEIIKKKRSIEEASERLKFDTADLIVSNYPNPNPNASPELSQFASASRMPSSSSSLLCASEFFNRIPNSSSNLKGTKTPANSRSSGKLSPVFNCSSGDMSYIDQEAVTLMMQLESKSNSDSYSIAKRQKTFDNQ